MQVVVVSDGAASHPGSREDPPERLRALRAGDLLMVHWTGATDYPLSGDEPATSLLRATASFTRPVRAERTDQYRLDLVRRVPCAPPDGG